MSVLRMRRPCQDDRSVPDIIRDIGTRREAWCVCPIMYSSVLCLFRGFVRVNQILPVIVICLIQTHVAMSR